MKTLGLVATFIIIGLFTTGIVWHFGLHGTEHHLKYTGTNEFIAESVYYTVGLLAVFMVTRKEEEA